MNKISITLAILFCAFSGKLSAQTSQITKITLQEAVETALSNNAQIKQAQNNLEAAEYSEFASKMNLFTPDLSAGINAGQTQGRQFNTVSGTIVDQITTSVSGRVSASYTIFDGWRNINNLRSASSSRVSQEERLKRAKEDIIFNVASQFLTILLDNQLLDIARENLKSSESQLGLIEAQVKIGSKPVADLYNQESMVANNELTVIQRENAISNDKMALIRTLQIDPLQEYEFITPDIKVDENMSLKSYDVQALIESALSTRSDLKALKASIETNRLGLESAKGQHYPSLSVSAGLSSSYNDRFVDMITRKVVPFSDQMFDRNRNMSYSFNLQIPIYSQFNTQNAVQRNKVAYKNSVLDYDNQKIAVAQEIMRAYSDYTSYSKQLESAEKALVSAKKVFETQQERYKIGASTLIELAQANAQFVEASSNRSQALFRVIFQEQLIEYYKGNISTDFKF